jgi:tRNA dimethylallyltransferase
MLPKVIAIIGPTASGKTALGIEIAKRWNGEIISVDSRQVYRGMDVGTGKVKGDKGFKGGEGYEDIKQLFRGGRPMIVDDVPHWGIDLVDPDEPYSAADYKTYTTNKIDEILSRGKLPILVGGTGLWLKTVIDNLDLTSTPSDPVLRVQLESRTLGDLFHAYKQLDPEGAELIDSKNKRRVVRALEVTILTGKPWSHYQVVGEPLYEVLQIGLSVPREELGERIDARVDEMVAHGLVDEVRDLKDQYGCEIESMTGIGYRQVCRFLLGEEKLKDAIEDVKKDSRAYAKRQMTWFKRDPRIVWVKPSDSIDALVGDFLNNKPTP